MAVGIIPFNKRIEHKNPLHPYSWQANYINGGRMKQFDFDGYHHAIEIDRSKIKELVILGHPDSPINLPLPYADRAPDEIIIKAQCDIAFTVELGTAEREQNVRSRCFFGFRYGNEKFLVLIDPSGKVMKTNSDA
jgi:hypothetical protein